MAYLLARRTPVFLKFTRSFSRFQSDLLISPRDVRHLPQKPFAFLDTSWFMPNSPRKPKDEFLKKRLPNAQLLDLDQLASQHELGLKHMMPSPKQFAEACGMGMVQTLGLGFLHLSFAPLMDSVRYDSQGVFSSPRALFMFRAFGHHNSSVLDGGLPRWEQEGMPIETSPTVPEPEHAVYPIPELDESTVVSYEQVVSNAKRDPYSDISAKYVLDARSAGRYSGQEPEPRPGLSSGHIPHSFSLPFTHFLDTVPTASGGSYTKFKAPKDIKASLLADIGPEATKQLLKGERRVVSTCGSGMTAGVLWLGLKLLGVSDVALYDESWTGYASRSSSTIVKVT